MRRTITEQPLVSEASPEQLTTALTPVGAFYVRNHFNVPQVDASAWRLGVEGQRAIELTLDDLRALPARELTVTLECAGNSRSALSRPADGVQFTNGGVSTATWRGARLGDVLALAGAPPEATEVLMQGLDEGVEAGRAIAYERSLPLAKALHADTLLAYDMNDKALTPEHGAPLRAIVPGWYGMASVKWLRRIRYIADAFDGFFQRDRYVFERPNKGDYQEPVDRIRLKSLILSPRPDTVVPAGDCMIEGAAWAGERAVAGVAVSVDGGATWRAAELRTTPQPYAWAHWQLPCALPAGEHALISRAYDDHGGQQRLDEDWNYRGYANSQAQTVRVFARR